MDPLVLAAQREREQLKKKLTDINARLAELETFLRISTTISTDDAGLTALVNRAVDDAARIVFQAKTAASPIKDQVTNTCIHLLETNARPLQTRELVQGLESRGIVLNGRDKVLQVSAILSRAKNLFVSDRKLGWSLRGAIKSEGPGAQTPEPSSRPRPHLSAARRQPHPAGLAREKE